MSGGGVMWCVVLCSAWVISFCRTLLLLIITCTINVDYDIHTYSFLSLPRFTSNTSSHISCCTTLGCWALSHSHHLLHFTPYLTLSHRISPNRTVSYRILPYSKESAAHGIRPRARTVYESRGSHPCFPAAPPSVRYELTGTYATLHCTVLHYTVLHLTAQHCTVLNP